MFIDAADGIMRTEPLIGLAVYETNEQDGEGPWRSISGVAWDRVLGFGDPEDRGDFWRYLRPGEPLPAAADIRCRSEPTPGPCRTSCAAQRCGRVTSHPLFGSLYLLRALYGLSPRVRARGAVRLSHALTKTTGEPLRPSNRQDSPGSASRHPRRRSETSSRPRSSKMRFPTKWRQRIRSASVSQR